MPESHASTLRAPGGRVAPRAGFIPPFKVHLCWFDNPNTDPWCAEVARALHEVLHRSRQDDAVQRPGVEIPVEYGRSLTGLLEALAAGDEPPVRVRLVIAIVDAAAFASERDRDTLRRAMARWCGERAGCVFLPLVLGGAWRAVLQASPGFEPIVVDRAAVADPLRRWGLGIAVCIAAGRALLARPPEVEPAGPRVLLSYARADGTELASALAAYFRDRAHLVAWHDQSFAPTGEEIARQLQRANGDAVVLVVRTDRYSESPECTLELLAAKQSRAPIVTLLATVDGEVTAPAYSGNHRTMNWHEGREIEVAGRCVQAWLHGHHFRANAAAALALAGLPADSDVLPRRPELLDLIGIGRTARRLVIHPDPPLTDGDATVLRTAHPGVRIATPTTLLGRVLLAQDPEPPLTGTTLAFSLSVAEDLPGLLDGRIGAGLTREHLDDVVYSIVLATLRSGARIAYGGDLRRDRGYARHLIDLHRSYGGLGTRGSAQLLCFLDRGTREGFDPDGIEFDPVDVAAPHGAETWSDVRPVLWHLAMREVMAERCTGRVLLGGKTRPSVVPDDGGYTGPWPGLLEEAWRTLRRDRALYVVGGFGGTAGLIARMLIAGAVPPELTRGHHAGALAARMARVDEARHALAASDGASPEVLLRLDSGRYADLEDLAELILARWQRFAHDETAWRNGLDIEENLRLLCSTDRTEITHLVFEGLRRIGGTASDALQLALYLGDIASVPKVDGYAVTVTPGVPRVGASAALEPHMDRTRGGPLAEAKPIALEAVGTSDLAGSHVVVAQLELPPIGQPVEAAEVARIAHGIAQEANRVGLESIACPAFATSFGLSVGDSARAIVDGFRRGRGHYPAKLVFCELDRLRYHELRAALGPEAVELRAGAPSPARTSGPVLYVDLDEPSPAGPGRVRVTLYVADAAQPVAPLSDSALSPALWDDLRRRITRFDDSTRIGRTLWRELLSPEIREELMRHGDRPLVVLGNDAASAVPWELLLEDRDGASPRPGGVIRRIALRGAFRPPADQIERSRLRVLVVADPRADLPNAVPEADAICGALRGRADVIVTRLDREQATRDAVVAELRRGYHDVFHYAGHALFDEPHPERSGLVLADGTLVAADLPALSPQLVFLSACESGRLRELRPPLALPPVRGNGRPLAEAFLRAGTRAFVGTFYAVDDASARSFASTVHAELAAGRTLGHAMRVARRTLHEGRMPDWGNFLLYGDDSLIL